MMRLEDAGFMEDRGVTKCTNCGGKSTCLRPDCSDEADGLA